MVQNEDIKNSCKAKNIRNFFSLPYDLLILNLYTSLSYTHMGQPWATAFKGDGISLNYRSLPYVLVKLMFFFMSIVRDWIKKGHDC